MTLKELKAQYANTNVADVEVYASLSGKANFHTDNLVSVKDENPDAEVVAYTEMDEEEYNSNVLANGGVTADFADWYGDKNAKVLVILVR